MSELREQIESSLLPYDAGVIVALVRAEVERIRAQNPHFPATCETEVVAFQGFDAACQAVIKALE